MTFDTPSRSALRPQLATTTTSADSSLQLALSPFRELGEVSPGKNALLHCTTAGFTPLRLDHENFMVVCPLVLLRSAFYPIRVPRLAASLHASFPQSVTFLQLRFASFAVINLRRDFHPQECAHAGRTNNNARMAGVGNSFFIWLAIRCNALALIASYLALAAI